MILHAKNNNNLFFLLRQGDTLDFQSGFIDKSSGN